MSSNLSSHPVVPETTGTLLFNAILMLPTAAEGTLKSIATSALLKSNPVSSLSIFKIIYSILTEIKKIEYVYN